MAPGGPCADGFPSSLPRSNGELVFEEPWESRAFAIAAALADQGVFDWADFQSGLIAAIAAGDHQGEAAYRYYECWLATLETLVLDRHLVEGRDLDARITAMIADPPHHHHDSGDMHQG